MNSSCTSVSFIDGGTGSRIGEGGEGTENDADQVGERNDGKDYAFNIFSAAIWASCTQSPMPMPL